MLRKAGLPVESPVCPDEGCFDLSGGRVGMAAMMAKIDAELLRIMVCPVTHAPLVQLGDWVYSTDPARRRKYPIRDGIPIMLIDESEVSDHAEFDRVMAKASNTK